MGLLDTTGWKFKPDIPYMSVGEIGMFKKLREHGTISPFRCATCEECGAEVPKGKQFCSKKCYETWQLKQEEDNGG